MPRLADEVTISEKLERFDFANARWRPTPKMTQEGAYRLSGSRAGTSRCSTMGLACWTTSSSNGLEDKRREWSCSRTTPQAHP